MISAGDYLNALALLMRKIDLTGNCASGREICRFSNFVSSSQFAYHPGVINDNGMGHLRRRRGLTDRREISPAMAHTGFYLSQGCVDCGVRTSEVAPQAQVNTQTLRYYERRGLLPEPERTRSGYRAYTPDAVRSPRSLLGRSRSGSR